MDRKFKRENPGVNRNKLTNDRETWYYSNLTLGAVVQLEHEREQAEASKLGHGQDSQFSTENNPYVTVVKPEPARVEAQRIRTQTFLRDTTDDRIQSTYINKQVSVQQQQLQQQAPTKSANNGHRRSSQQYIQEEGYVSVSMERESSSNMPASQRVKHTIYNDQFSKKE